MSRHALWWSLALLGVPAALAGGVAWMVGGLPFAPISDEAIISGDWGEAPPANPPRLRVLSYNMHFGIGRDDDHTKVSRADVERILAEMAALINKLNADVVLLQEVDFDSARTFGIDQMNVLARATGMRHMAPVKTWIKGYIPFPYWPPSAHYGRMDSGQAVLSRYPITRNTAIRLPKPAANPFYYNAFYLTRTMQEVDVTVGTHSLRLYNIHTEAYDVPNRQIHAEMIAARLREHALSCAIAAGDFNAVPPEASVKHAFADEPETDMRADRSVETLRQVAGFTDIIPEDRYTADESAALTFPADVPNRRLDYLYYSSAFRLIEGRIVHEAGPLSDHLPTLAELAFAQEEA
jgi:endonuclease/exonuclease/phosphatase family metal-dependent hydrolase